jgi:adenylate kinase
MKPYPAILIVDPTGSGKTPLGGVCEANGLWWKPCVHFDFGTALRKIAQDGAGLTGLTDADISIIMHMLKSGGLLENKIFYIARKFWQLLQKKTYKSKIAYCL